jgi:LmbE family N-acetylglucosaminyl deacetylase
MKNLGSILAIGAHPDDIEIGLGGLLLLLTLSGLWKVYLLVATRGECGGDPEIRTREQEAAAALLGASLLWGDLPDSRVSLRPAIKVVEDALSRTNPDLVFVHTRRDTHQDHRTLHAATIAAARSIPNLLCYEGPSTSGFRPTTFVDIAPVVGRKLELVRCHRSQLARTRIVEWTEATARYRGWALRARSCEGLTPHRQVLTLPAVFPIGDVAVNRGELHAVGSAAILGEMMRLSLETSNNHR